ncbi:MAG: HAMP domain-containing sensor histidine kinase [Steroidobacteraceae bacterium]
MLHELLAENRTQLVYRCRLKLASRSTEIARNSVCTHGPTQLLDQIIKTLQIESTRGSNRACKVLEFRDGYHAALSELGATSRRHAQERLRHGYTIGLLVQEFGDLCQAVVDLAADTNSQIEADEFKILIQCLNQAAANSVTEFCHQCELGRRTHETDVFREQLGVLVHEARNLIATANYAMLSVRTERALLKGSTDETVGRCLAGLGNLIERSIETVRTDGRPRTHEQDLNLSDFVADVQLAARLEAQACECVLIVTPVDPHLAVYVDRDMLLSAVSNLLQNAFKFTAPRTEVILSVYAISNLVRIDVQDSCGGWTSGDAEQMFQPFKQCGENRSGLGLGLSICRRCVEANHGSVSARNIPGEGCMFSIELPRLYSTMQSTALA